jgi:hypothetical protein
MAEVNLFSIKESNLFNSCKKLVTTSLTYEAVLPKVPYFVVIRDKMNVTIQSITAIEKSHNDNPDTTEVVKEKNDQLSGLMDNVGSLAKTVKVIAINQNDSDGEAKAEKALSPQTRNLAQEIKLQVASEFADYALTIDAALLEQYGITKEELSAIKPKSVAIRAFLIQKDGIVEQKSTNKESLASLLTQLEAGKNEMMALIDRYQSHAPKFVSSFNRIVSTEVRLNNQMAQKHTEDLQKDKEKKLVAQQKKLMAKEKKTLLQQQKPAGRKKRPLTKKMMATMLDAQKVEAETLKVAIKTPEIDTDKLA